MADELTMKDALERWAEGPNLLEAALAELAEADLDCVDAEEGWSIREIVHHLADADAMWTAYLKVALITPGSRLSLSWHPGNKGIANALEYAARPIAPSLALFRANREHVLQMVSAIPGAWEQHLTVVDLPEWAEVREERITVGEYVTGLAKHVQEHLDEIIRIRKRIADEQNDPILAMLGTLSFPPVTNDEIDEELYGPLGDRHKNKPEFGSAKGLITIADDFDEPLDDFKSYME